MRNTQPLGQSLARIERHLSKLWRDDEDTQRFHQLSFNEFDYLYAVSELNQPRLSDLAAVLSVTKPSASCMVRKLEKKALLQRCPCPNDGRAILVSLTKEGQTLMALDHRLFSRLTDKVKTSLPTEDYEKLESLLTTVCKQL